MSRAELDAVRVKLVDILTELRGHVDITMPGDRYRELSVRVEAALASQAPVVRKEPDAWLAEDGRVIPKISKETADRAGGPFATAVRDYHIPLFRVAPSPQGGAEDAIFSRKQIDVVIDAIFQPGVRWPGRGVLHDFVAAIDAARKATTVKGDSNAQR